MSVKYTITITKTEAVNEPKGNNWTVVEERPYTKAELKDSFDAELFKNTLKEVRGYTPMVDNITVKETEIFKQTVENLNMQDVIFAVNSLTPRNGDR